MRGLYSRLFLGLAILLLMVTFSTLNADVANPDSVVAMAIYRATVDTRDDWPDSMVSYNVTDRDTINAMLTGIEGDTLRDCSDFKADDDAYIYIKYSNQTRRVYHLFLRWTHFSFAGHRENCYYVEPASQELFQRHAQE